jgi:hypothetical protein
MILKSDKIRMFEEDAYIFTPNSDPQFSFVPHAVAASWQETARTPFEDTLGHPGTSWEETARTPLKDTLGHPGTFWEETARTPLKDTLGHPGTFWEDTAREDGEEQGPN